MLADLSVEQWETNYYVCNVVAVDYLEMFRAL